MSRSRTLGSALALNSFHRAASVELSVASSESSATVRRSPSVAAPRALGALVRPWVRLVIDLPETLSRNLSVDLGGLDVHVPEKLLHAAEIGIPLEQVRREGMPEGMRGDLSSRNHLFRVLFHHRAHVPLSDPPALAVVEQRRGRRTFPHRPAACMGDIAPDRVHPDLPQRNEAFLPSLPEDAEPPRREVHIFEIEGCKLPDADAGAVQDLKDRAIARPERV